MVWVHWVVYNIPPDTKSLPENVGKARLPQSALLGLLFAGSDRGGERAAPSGQGRGEYVAGVAARFLQYPAI